MDGGIMGLEHGVVMKGTSFPGMKLDDFSGLTSIFGKRPCSNENGVFFPGDFGCDSTRARYIASDC
jgi:hypothetical protein